MRSIFVVTGIAAGAALAYAANIVWAENYKSAREFVEMCKEPISDDCMLRYLASSTAGNWGDQKTCEPTSVGRGAEEIDRGVIRKIVAWLKKNPSLLSTSATEGIIKALKAEYPCK